MSFFSVKHLSKSFGNNKVLDDVSLEINTGEVVAVIGPSGTGKSTLLRCINLLEIPESGEVEFEGEKFDLTTKDEKIQRQLRSYTEMVFQQFHLFRMKNVLENVMEGLLVVKKMSKESAKQEALKELKNVDMLDRLYHYPKHISGGQQQRVAIARALAMKPKLLLMDEPTSALDPELVNEVLQTIKKVAREGHTILLVTHEMSFVKDVATRVIFLENGKIVVDAPTEEFFTNPKTERLKTFLVNSHVLEENNES